MASSLPARLAAALAVPFVPWFSRDPTALRAHAGRLAAPAQLEAWGRRHRDPARPLVWLHAASVGEGLQARAILNALRTIQPNIQAVYTHFSPSAEQFATTVAADLTCYIPYDRSDDMARAVSGLRPDLVAFVKVDVWPVLATTAVDRLARVAIVAGTVDPKSARLRWPARAVARPGYAAADAIGAISQSDAERLAELGARAQRIAVTGDPRIDSVLDVIATQPTQSPDQKLLVAGSTWPADEDLLLEAFATVRQQHPDARLLLVPHQPSSEHLERLDQAILARGLQPVRWHDTPISEPVAVVNQLGVLAGLYGLGGMAYVGGGWGNRGVHSVLEPVGWALPVIIGPHDRGLRDARLLEGAGALVRLPARHAAEALTRTWLGWLNDPASRSDAGQAGLQAIEAERGAAVRNAELLARLL